MPFEQLLILLVLVQNECVLLDELIEDLCISFGLMLNYMNLSLILLSYFPKTLSHFQFESFVFYGHAGCELFSSRRRVL